VDRLEESPGGPWTHELQRSYDNEPAAECFFVDDINNESFPVRIALESPDCKTRNGHAEGNIEEEKFSKDAFRSSAFIETSGNI